MISTDVKAILDYQKKILQAVNDNGKAAVASASHITEAIQALADAAKAQADTLKSIASTLDSIAKLQQRMADDLDVIRVELQEPPPDNTPVSLTVEPGEPTPRK